VTPILVRPVREQLEHDRTVRALQAKFKRRYEVQLGTESDQPDLILTAGGRKPRVVIEVETGESVNNLEAMAQWARFARMRAPFHLYVPSGSIESARRLSADNNIPVAEIWSFHAIGDQIHFTLAHRATPVGSQARRSAATRTRSRTLTRPRRQKTATRAAKRGRRTAPLRKSTRPQKRR
jgi:hypothetical protein